MNAFTRETSGMFLWNIYFCGTCIHAGISSALCHWTQTQQPIVKWNNAFIWTAPQSGRLFSSTPSANALHSPYLFGRLLVFPLLFIWLRTVIEVGLERLLDLILSERGSSGFPDWRSATNRDPKQNEHHQQPCRCRGQEHPRRVDVGIQTQIEAQLVLDVFLPGWNYFFQTAGKYLCFFKSQSLEIRCHFFSNRFLLLSRQCMFTRGVANLGAWNDLCLLISLFLFNFNHWIPMYVYGWTK